MSETVKQILGRFQSDPYMGRQGKVYTDTSDFMRITGGDVLVFGDGHYLVLRDMDTNKILVAIDGSENSKRAVEYVADIVKGCRDFEITLLHIERLPDRDIFADEDAWKKACAAHRQKIDAFLSDNKQMIAEYGIPQKRVSTDYVESCQSPLAEEPPYCSRGTSIAQDILHVAEKEHFGTVVIGRRGVSKAEEFMFGSVSTKIIHSGKDCTIWVVQ